MCSRNSGFSMHRDGRESCAREVRVIPVSPLPGSRGNMSWASTSSTIDHIDLKGALWGADPNGIRDAFSLDRLKALLPESASPCPSPSPSFELAELPPLDGEAWLLVQATGTRSVGRLAFMLRDRLGERQVYAVLYALLLLQGCLGRARVIGP